MGSFERDEVDMERVSYRWVLAGALIVAATGGCSGAEESRRCASADGCTAPPTPADDGGANAGTGVDNPGGAGGSLVDPAEAALGVRFEDAQDMAIDVVILACNGECVDVEAVVRGGNPPYQLEWDDGSNQAVRQVCPDADTELTVQASDTPIHVEEFDYDGQTVTAMIPTRTLECSDGGVCETGAGADTPASGRYEGTGSYVCDNDMSAQAASLINHLVVSLDLEIDPSAERQTGGAYFQWGLIVIAGAGQLEGSLECGGALRATLHDGTWGLPGPDPMTVIPTGTVTGEFTARRASEDTITGSWHWTSMSAVGAYGNMCNGTYEAKLVAP
jgi:hypothetical protein